MKLFGVAVFLNGRVVSGLCVPVPQHIAVLLSPGDVAHLGNDKLQRPSITGVAVIQIQRAEVIAPVPQLAQHANRSVSGAACLSVHDTTHTIL